MGWHRSCPRTSYRLFVSGDSFRKELGIQQLTTKRALCQHALILGTLSCLCPVGFGHQPWQIKPQNSLNSLIKVCPTTDVGVRPHPACWVAFGNVFPFCDGLSCTEDPFTANLGLCFFFHLFFVRLSSPAPGSLLHTVHVLPCFHATSFLLSLARPWLQPAGGLGRALHTHMSTPTLIARWICRAQPEQPSPVYTVAQGPGPQR